MKILFKEENGIMKIKNGEKIQCNAHYPCGVYDPCNTRGFCPCEVRSKYSPMIKERNIK